MKSDISRQTFNPRKHHNRVVMQQGRVQLDADWNEQQDIVLHRINTQSADIIGQGSVSADNNGFEVKLTPDGKDLVIAPGYMYVDGILCELEQEAAIDVERPIKVKKSTLSIRRQNVDNSAFQKGRWIELLDKDEQSLGLLKITDVDDQDQQIITLSFDLPFPRDSDDIVKIRPVTTYLTQPNYPISDPELKGLPKLDTPDNEHVLLVYLDVWERQVTVLDDPGIVEVALGGADTAQRSQALWQIKIVREKIPSEESRPFHEKRPSKKLLEKIKEDSGTLSQVEHDALKRDLSRLLRIFTFTPPFSEWSAPLPAYTGRFSARLTAVGGNDAGAYRGLENQLYHVEIHEGNDDIDGIPTFKWARNNASSLVAMTIRDGQVMVEGSGRGSLLGLTVGQYVELLDEPTELLALPGHMAQIKQVNDITGLLMLAPPPPEDAKYNQLRFWNAYAPIDGSEGLQVSKDGWIAMEGGVEIQFTLGDTYRSGDYWLIPARPATGKIEWPHTTPQPPTGIQHHYTRLACLLRTQTIALQQDCRARFFPLAADALHILDINWKNDVAYSEEKGHRLLRKEEGEEGGLRITLDRSPDQECAKAMHAAMVVSVETALPSGGAGIFVINGVFKIEDNVITWHWHRREKQGFPKILAELDELGHELFSTKVHFQRLRITLKGHLIWRTVNGRRIYLDGQAFGMPGPEPSGHKPIPPETEQGKHIDLQFPSGAGRAASDFESWFYMEE